MKTLTVTETGHAKNVDNFKVEIASAKSFGAEYNPSKKQLMIPALETLSNECEVAIMNVSTARSEYKLALDARNSAFDPLNKITTRLINSLKASSSTDHLDKSAREYVRKIQGVRAKAKRTEEEKKADEEAGITYSEISSSQMSFDNRANNFREFAQFLSKIPDFQPNEKELQPDSLKLYGNELKEKNTAVVNAMMALNNARARRNELMYKPVTGMVDIALDLKSYVKSVFGPSSIQYKKISTLDFVKN